MTSPVEERAYRWARWYAFGLTVAVVVVVVIVLIRLA
jgi:t-SNARE complex subunit (syntaxin)